VVRQPHLLHSVCHLKTKLPGEVEVTDLIHIPPVPMLPPPDQVNDFGLQQQPSLIHHSL
jgi:hypothetical protein